eukprot:jgi/Chrpa1/24596/Chrysochromulina_OHIO_Genome00016563-RA
MLALQLVMLGAAFMAPPRVASGPHAATLIGRYAVARTAALVMETTELAAAADPYNKSEALQMPTTFESYQERAAAGVVAAAALSTLGMDALLAVDGSLGLMSLALATGVVAANANNDTAVGRGLLALGDAVSNVLDNTIGNAKKTREGIERERMARIDQLKQEGSQVIASRKALQSAFEDEIASRMAHQSAFLKRASAAELAALLARAGDELLGGTAAPAPSLTVPTMSPVVQRAPEAAPEATPVPEAPVPPPLAAMASPPLASPPAMARQADILPSRMPVAPSTPSTPALARAPAFTFMPGAPSSQLPPPPRSESPPTAANVPKPNVNRAVPRPEVVTASIAPKPNVNFGAAAPTRAPVTADTVPRPKSNAPPRSEADKAVSSASLNVAEVMSDTSLPKASANRDDSSQCVWAAVKLRDGVSDTKFPPARLLSEFPEALSVECIFDDRGRCRSQCLVFPAAMKSKQLQSSVLGCWVKPLKQPMEPNAREGYNWVSYTREQLIARSGHEVAW